MRKIVHTCFTPRAMEAWRPFVQKAVAELLMQRQRAHDV
jgi:cytochrome P450